MNNTKTSYRVEYAWRPRPSNHSYGNDHLVTNEAIDVGRFRRAPGDALCKPRHKFWQLEPNYSTKATCKRCLQIAEKLAEHAR